MNIAAANARFPEVRDDFDAIEGMAGVASAHLFHLLLAEQAHRTTGPMLETGVYKGKSAIVLAHHLQPNEWLDLVDINDYGAMPAFKSFGDRVRLHLGPSEGLNKLIPHYRSQRKRYRFMHSDGSHSFANVYHDVLHADALLSEQGILAVDDYQNSNYPQVPLAVGAALYGRKARLTPFLVANNKGYFCRPSQRQHLLALVLNDFAPTLIKEYHYLIACTDLDARAPVTLRPAEPGEEGDVYGSELYGDFVDTLRGRLRK